LATLNNDATVTYNGRPFGVGRVGLPTDTEIGAMVNEALPTWLSGLSGVRRGGATKG
jgi:hypothetical protein